MRQQQDLSRRDLAIEAGTPIRSSPLPLEFPGAHYMDEQEVEAVTRVLRARSTFRYYGLDPQRETETFESEFARFIGVRYALAVGSGTGALHTALAALGVGPGQEIIVPAYLWVSVVAAVVNLGAIPVLADIDETFCLNPESVRHQITPRTRGIILIHMSGAPGDATAISEIATEHGVFLLEDCAQCAGGAIGRRQVGSFGDMAIFSFQMNKNMTSGEGGCVVTNELKLYRRAFASHDLGYARDQGGRLIFDDPELCLWGRGYRMDKLRSAVLRVQLRKLPTTIQHMRDSKYRIRQALARFEDVRLRRILDPSGDTGCFLITTYSDSATALAVNVAMRAEGIVTYEQGMSNVLMSDWELHLYYNNLSLIARRGLTWDLAANEGFVRDYSRGACPFADSLFERSILIPIPSCLTLKDKKDIVLAFEKSLSAIL